MSNTQETSESKTDPVAARFEKACSSITPAVRNQDPLSARFIERFLCLFYYNGCRQITWAIEARPTDQLRLLFRYRWENDINDSPSGEVLMRAMQLTFHAEMDMPRKELTDHIEECFREALDEHRIQEHNKRDIPRCEETNGNAFCRDGDAWTLVYRGQEFPRIKHQKGYELIAYVLGCPKIVFSTPLEFETAVNGSESIDSLTRKMSEEQLEKEGLSTQGLQDRLHADNTAIRNYKKRLDEINEEIAEAEQNHDLALVSALSEEKESLIQEIRCSGIIKSKGKWDHDNEKARKRISSAINRALKDIQKHETKDIGLSNHLDTHLTPVSFPYSYNPDPPIDWTT